MKLGDIRVMTREEYSILFDSLYSALDLIKNELGEGQVTEKLRASILIIGESYEGM